MTERGPGVVQGAGGRAGVAGRAEGWGPGAVLGAGGCARAAPQLRGPPARPRLRAASPGRAPE